MSMLLWTYDLSERGDFRRKVMQLASEVQGNPLLRDLDRRQQCRPVIHANATIAPVLDAIDRCPNPSYRIRKISADAIVWTRVPKSKAKKKKKKFGSNPSVPSNSSSGASGDAGEESDGPSRYMAFLLMVNNDKPSAELNSLAIGVASAFPEVVFLRGDAEQFSSLAAELSLKGFPQLLLFEDGILKDRFRGNRDVDSLVRFFIDGTATLPRCLVTPPPVPDIPPRITWLYLLSCAFVILRVALAVAGGRRKGTPRDQALGPGRPQEGETREGGRGAEGVPPPPVAAGGDRDLPPRPPPLAQAPHEHAD